MRNSQAILEVLIQVLMRIIFDHKGVHKEICVKDVSHVYDLCIYMFAFNE